jgi:hypothetical protein
MIPMKTQVPLPREVEYLKNYIELAQAEGQPRYGCKRFEIGEGGMSV